MLKSLKSADVWGLVLVLASALSFSQSLPPASGPPATATVSAFPQQFITAGVQYSSHVSPHYSGWLAGAKCLNSPCSGTYSFTGIYITPGPGGKPVTNTTTGIGQYMRDVGPFGFYAIGAAGAATSAASSAGGTAIAVALNGGLFAISKPSKRGFSFNVLAQAVSSSGLTTVTVGVGVGWGGQ